MMRWTWGRLFSFAGRLGRKSFVLNMMLAHLIGAVYMAAGMIFMRWAVHEAHLQHNATVFWIALAMMLCGMAALVFSIIAPASLMVRRLHDLGLSAWHLVWIYGGPFLIGFANGFAAGFATRHQGTQVHLIVPVNWLGQVFILLVFVWLTIAKGQPGANRYGRPPNAGPRFSNPWVQG